MDGGAKKVLESVTYKTLHAHNFSRSSSQATVVLTDILSRYLELLTSTCAKYAEHAGRLSLSVRDAVSALDELGVGVEELGDYCTSEGKEISRYAVLTARRMEDLSEFKALLANGLREDRDDAISLVYAHMPSPVHFEEEEEDTEVSDEEDESEGVHHDEQHKDATMETDTDVFPLAENALSFDTKSYPTTPPLPLSPISNPSTPPRKRPRTASWQPPPHVPGFLPPFPTDSPMQPPRSSPAPMDTVAQPNPVKFERTATPPPPQIATSASSADYLTPIIYYQSSLASVNPSHLPSPPPDTVSSLPQADSRLPLPQTQPALLGAYHHVLTHPPPPNVTSVNPARYRVALALLAQAEMHPAWEPAPTLFSSTAPNPPRVAAMGPSYPVADKPGSPTDVKESDIDKDRKPNLPNVPPRSVVHSERVTPLLSLQSSRLPSLARQVLPGSVYTRTTRLTHPPVLYRGTHRLTYGPGVSAPWNTNAPASSPAMLATSKGKDGNSTGPANGTDAGAKALPEARLFATWDYEQKRFNEPLNVRRGRVGSMHTTVGTPLGRGRSESWIS